MLLAGGQGSRLHALTSHVAKPAVPFGGKYRIIDFPLSNCINSGIDTDVYKRQAQGPAAGCPEVAVFKVGQHRQEQFLVHVFSSLSM